MVEWGGFWIVLGSMALQHRLLVAAGSLLITSLCPVLAPAGSILTEDGVKAVLGAINAVAGGNVASALDAILDSGDDGRLLWNCRYFPS